MASKTTKASVDSYNDPIYEEIDAGIQAHVEYLDRAMWKLRPESTEYRRLARERSKWTELGW